MDIKKNIKKNTLTFIVFLSMINLKEIISFEKYPENLFGLIFSNYFVLIGISIFFNYLERWFPPAQATAPRNLIKIE